MARFYGESEFCRSERLVPWLPKGCLIVQQNNDPVISTFSLIYNELDKPQETLGYFRFSGVPACCGSLFLSQVSSRGHYYNKTNMRLGHALVALAVRMAELGTYSSLDCIVPVASNGEGTWQAMAHILLKFGFIELKNAKVLNARSGNTLRYFQKKLLYPKGYELKNGESIFIPENWNQPAQRKAK